jgi:hypothetical protein
MKKFVFLFVIALTVNFSCTRNLVQPQYISLFGQVRLQGQSDFGGVKVSLYPISEVDSTVLEATDRYISLPLLQTQAFVFDHRKSEPLYTATISAEGHYEFIDVPQARYNLVIEKRGYGWRYLCNVDGTEELDTVTLVREIRQAGVLDPYTEWPAYQHVVVTGTITVPGNGALLVDKGAVVRFDGNYRINGDGQINCFGSTKDPVWFTSNTVGEYETQTYWAGINLSEAGTFKDVKMDYAKVALSVRSSTLTLERGVFAQINDTGIFASNESVVDISNSYFYDSNMGVVCETQTTGRLHYNIFSTISETIESSAVVANASTIEASDNFINACSRGLSMLYGANGEISHNDVANCRVGMYNFSFDRDVLFSVTENTFSNCLERFIEIHHASTPIIQLNNFIGSTGQEYLYAFSKSLHYYEDLDATQNYWDGLPATEASRLITDERVLKEGGGDATWKILVNPVAGEMNENAHPR